eukprot:scaffold49151_cov69-Phaeocystis_antarctica.AAC.2
MEDVRGYTRLAFFSRFEFWISLIAAASISVSAPPLSGLHLTTAAPLERRRSSSRPSGATASLPRSAASLNSSSSAAACGGAVRGRLAGGGGWCVDAGAGGGAPPSRRRSSASSASLTSEASCWIGMPVRCPYDARAVRVLRARHDENKQGTTIRR